MPANEGDANRSHDTRTAFEVLHPDAAASSRFWLPLLVSRSSVLVWKAARRELLHVAALQVLSAVGVAGQVFVAHALLAAVTSGGDRAFRQMIPALAALIGLMIALEFGRTLEAEQTRLLAELVARHALARVLETVTRAELIEFEKPSFYDSVRRAQLQGGFRATQTVQAMLGIFGSAMAALALIAALATLQPYLVPVVVVGYIPLWLTARLNSRDAYAVAWELTANDRQRAYLERVMLEREPAKEIRAFHAVPYLKRRYNKLYDERLAQLRALARRRTQRGFVSASTSSAVTAFALSSLGWLVSTDQLTVPAAGAALLGFTQLASRLRGLHTNAMSLYESALFMRDYTTLVERDEAPGRPRQRMLRGIRHVAAESVTFRYPGAKSAAVVGVSIEISAGEIVALVGENGSGKTTVAKLLAALYRPQEGRVLWDGVDAASVDLDELRGDIAVVFQDFERYLLTARENVGLGRHERIDDREAVVAAALRADADSFLGALPNGYETQLGREFSGGYELSVGQWQRVAVARAFFRDAPFLILDEPAAALDARAEAGLFNRIRMLLAGRSALVISHRFSGVRLADRIYVLANGRVVEEGTHDELVRAGGAYAELFALQAATFDAETKSL